MLWSFSGLVYFIRNRETVDVDLVDVDLVDVDFIRKRATNKQGPNLIKIQNYTHS